MTDLEARKIARLFDIKDIWLNDDGVMCIQFKSNRVGHVYIYDESFNTALPFRMLKSKSRHCDIKSMLELLLKQSADGIRSAVVTFDKSGDVKMSKFGNLTQTKFMGAYETIESLLVKYDLKFCKKTNRKSKN